VAYDPLWAAKWSGRHARVSLHEYAEGALKDIIERISIPVFYGFILVVQPLWSWLAAHWLVRRWVSRNHPTLGWLVGLGSLVGVYILGLLGIFLRLDLSHKWYGSYPTCYEYTGLSYLFDYASGGICLVVFLITAIRVTRQHGRVARD
jgi:hypothetical protein